MKNTIKSDSDVKADAKRRPVAMVVYVLLVVTAVVLLLHELLHINQEKISLQLKMTALEHKLAEIQNKPVMESAAYATAQIKDAYLLTRTAALSLENDGDVPVAKQLLQLAVEHLLNVQDPKIVPVKNKLQADLDRLNGLTLPDVPALQDKFKMLDKLIVIMPAHGSHSNYIAAENNKDLIADNVVAKKTWWQSIRNFFSGLKSIVRVHKKTAGGFSLAQVDIEVVRAQIKLLLAQMRWAAYYNNPAVYNSCITSVQELVPTAFDMQNASVQKFVTVLQELAKIQLRPELPNIQDSVNAVQALLFG